MASFVSELVTEIRVARAADRASGPDAKKRKRRKKARSPDRGRGAGVDAGTRLGVLVLAGASRGFTLVATLCRVVVAIWLFDLFGMRAVVAGVVVVVGFGGLRMVALECLGRRRPFWAASAVLAWAASVTGAVLWVLLSEERPAVAGLIVASEVAAWTARWLIGEARRDGGRAVVVV